MTKVSVQRQHKQIILKHWAAWVARERKHLECTSTKPSVRVGTGRDGTGWDGTGRDGTGWDGTDAAECDDGNMTCVCRIVGFNRTLKLWIQNLRHEEENPSVIHCAFICLCFWSSRLTDCFSSWTKLCDVTVVVIFYQKETLRPFPCNLNPSPCSCSFLNIYSFFIDLCYFL